MKEKATIQAKRRARMNRLSHDPSKRYDVRQHRRGTYVAVTWMHGEGVMDSSLREGMMRQTRYYSRKRFARNLRQKAARS
jgi:hypothetical protein